MCIYIYVCMYVIYMLYKNLGHPSSRRSLHVQTQTWILFWTRFLHQWKSAIVQLCKRPGSVGQALVKKWFRIASADGASMHNDRDGLEPERAAMWFFLQVHLKVHLCSELGWCLWLELSQLLISTEGQCLQQRFLPQPHSCKAPQCIGQAVPYQERQHRITARSRMFPVAPDDSFSKLQ